MTKARSNATAPNAKGTLVVGNGTDASTTLAVASTAGYLLTVDSAEATGLKWAAASSPAYAWTSYTPTLNGLTQGNGTLNASYVRIGNKTIIVRIEFIFGSTSSVTGAVSFTMPSGATVEKMVEGKVALNDAGSNFHQGTSFVLPGDSNISVYADKADGTYLNTVVLSSTVPHTWATNDYIRFILLWQES